MRLSTTGRGTDTARCAALHMGEFARRLPRQSVSHVRSPSIIDARFSMSLHRLCQRRLHRLCCHSCRVVRSKTIELLMRSYPLLTSCRVILANPTRNDGRVHWQSPQVTCRLRIQGVRYPRVSIPCRLPSRAFEKIEDQPYASYYEPIRTLSDAGPVFCELGDETAAKAHVPCSSPDKALTAFCQLGALRIGTRRSMLFFFDESYAYILAEATQTLSLEDDSKHEIDDSLWLGHTVIPRGFSVCEHTVRMDISSLSTVEDPPQIHIINDLRQNTRFCDRPFVTGGPKARFYAGVPITTPNGINIGAYCVLDDKPRDGLARKDILFLREMSNTVMTHLNMARAKDEQRRGLRMVQALSTFVDDAHGSDECNSPAVNGRLHQHHQFLTRSTIRHEDPVSASDHVSPATSKVWHDRTTHREPKLSSAQAQYQPPSVAEEHVPVVTASVHSGSDQSAPDFGTCAKVVMPGIASHDYGVNPTHIDLIPQNVRATFQRAADLVRGATEVDGALFLDASRIISARSTRANDAQNVSYVSSAQTKDGSRDPEQSDFYVTAEACVTLGASGEPRDPQFTHHFLGSLLEKYKKGKIWNFDKNLTGYSGDEPTDESKAKGFTNSMECILGESQDREDGICPKEIKEIQRLFPGVRNLAIRGLWDEENARWYAACVTWTYSPLRVLSASEMNYIAAFCDVIMAEVKRQEAQASDKAKTDFISSISHELRSPLHGILGSVECIQDQVESNSYTKELEQIETCGRTLLDIVDHLLDASMLMFEKPKATSGLSRSGKRRTESVLRSNGTLTGLRSVSEDVSLAKITDETVDTVVYAFSCRKDKQKLLHHHVRVAMTIDDFDSPRWNVHLSTGAYRRIVINLISNALKYTETGYVSISLRAKELAGDPNRFNVVLEVRDSGRGMSQEYLQNSAFRAFSQEDSFVEGTGLGLNLVANILKQLGGKIDIHSERSVGTHVAITIPLMHAEQTNSLAVSGTSMPKADQMPRGEALVTYSSRATVGTPMNFAARRTHHFDPDRCETGSTPIATSVTALDQSKGFLHTSAMQTGGKLYESDNQSAELTVPSIGLVIDGYADGMVQSDISKTQLTISLMEESMRNTCTQLGFRFQEKDSLQSLNTDLKIITESAVLKMSQRSLTEDRRTPITSRPLIIVTRTAQSERSLRAQSGLAARLTTAHVEYVRSHWVLGLAKAIMQCTSLAQSQRLTSSSLPESMHTASRDILFADTATISTATQELSIQPAFSDTTVKPDADASRPSKIRDDKERQATDLCLLIVDDNPINIQILATYARKQGHPNLVATNGEEAVRVYKDTYHSEAVLEAPQHKIILLDINMPVMDGYEAARQIRDHEHKHDLTPAKIIALTGLGSAAAQQEAFESGMDLFLTKPVSLRALKKLIGEIRAGSLQFDQDNDVRRPARPLTTAAMSGPHTFINLPPAPSDPVTPSEVPSRSGTPNSTTTSMSELSTVAIKDGHRGHLPHQHGYAPSSGLSNQLDAERADRISRLAGLERVTTARNPTSSPGNPIPSSVVMPPSQQPHGYFDASGNPALARERSTVGSASATGSVGARTTWAGSEAGDADKMSESADQDVDMDATSSVGGYSEENGSLVGFGEGARTPARQSVISSPGKSERATPTAREPRYIDGVTYDADGVETAGGRSSMAEQAERIVRENMNTTSADRMRGGSKPGDLGKFGFEK
nr:hybrid signal transduction histidine kinase b [Quercus suber]